MENSTKPRFSVDVQKSRHKSKWKIKNVLLIILAVIPSCIFVSLLIENFPRFIILDFPSPNIEMNKVLVNGWESTSYSIQLNPVFPPIIDSKVFIWRRDTVLSNGTFSGNVTWQKTIDYFDIQFSKFGWKRTAAYTPCEYYFSEARFLPVGKNGYVAYRPENYSEVSDFRGGNFICLAVWKDTYLNGYRSTFITLSQSPLDYLFSIH
jgi:hypothetical protein